MKKVSLTIDELLFEELQNHLFPGDNDEHGAVIAAGISEINSEIRLLARELFIARDGIEYIPGQRGYRALTAQFVAEVSDYCAREKLCYLAVHCHGGKNSVGFSQDDIDSHERGYPALLDITNGGPVAGIVFAENAVAGDIWTREGRYILNHVKVVGTKVYKLYPKLIARPKSADPIYDRNTRLFGDIGQEILNNLKVGIIGLGGGGSLLNQWLAHLGVGHIVAIDPERIDYTNLPRVVGATRWDAKALLTQKKSLFLRKIGNYFAKYKVQIAERVAKNANPGILYKAIVGNILDKKTVEFLLNLDFIFLATDNIQSRLVFNAIVHQYLIPGAQVGVKIPKIRETQEIGEIIVNTRLVLPYQNGGCLECHSLIPPGRLQEESLLIEERKQQRYLDDDEVHEPSVITLNALSAAQAANDLMMIFTGIYHESVRPEHLINFVRKRELMAISNMYKTNCPDCSNTSFSRRARGDKTSLPCKQII